MRVFTLDHIHTNQTRVFSEYRYQLSACLATILIITLAQVASVQAASTSFTQTINPGVLSVDIVDGSYASVGSPSVLMSDVTFSFACQTSTGTLGTASEKIYVTNPDAADSGWSISIAAAATSTVWTSAGTPFDFNDPGGTGCTDTSSTQDTDTYGGQMTVDPSVATLTSGQCSSCTSANITKGSSASFNAETSTNSITMLSGAGSSDDIGDWELTGIDISQTIPGEQPAAGDYSINLTISVVAS